MSKADLTLELLQLFRDHGYEGTTLSRIAQATGLGKASLYHHFPKGKEEMAAAVIRHLAGWYATHLLKPLQGSGSAPDRLTRMTQTLATFYDQGQQPCIFAIFALGGARDQFQAPVRQIMRIWTESLATVLVDAGIPKPIAYQRAEDAIVRIQGSLVLAQAMGDTGPFQRVLKDLPSCLLAMEEGE
jgi:TetR/AcrR family transcriptional regulator, lmrAB and yxaGH operons repressor